MSANDIIRAQFFRRNPDGTFTPRGAEIGVASASGGWYVNRIGYGKLTGPATGILSTGVQSGDFAAVWAVDTDWTQPRRVAQFIVQTRQYKGATIELSGPNYLGALNDLIVFDRIGEATTVSSVIEGFQWHPGVGTRAPMAAYKPRRYATHDASTAAGQKRFNVLAAGYYRVGDTLTIDFTPQHQDAELFVTEITGVSDNRGAIEVADELPYLLPARWPFDVYSKMINVADASVFTVGERVRITSTSEGFPTVISGVIADAQVVTGAEDVLTLDNYILRDIPIGYYAFSTSYNERDTEDVEHLLENATSRIWTVARGPNSAYQGTTYDPKGETVFQVLAALSEVTGYVFRLGMSGEYLTPRNRLDWFPDLEPYPANTRRLATLGVENRIGPDYGEILELETEDANEIVTHLVPFGGGSGDSRFTIAEADTSAILANYPDISFGIDGEYPHIFNRTLSAIPPRWRTETFGSIRPENEASPSERRRAANDLLTAACEWLMINSRPDVTYKVTCYTQADPWPGDVVTTIDYSGIEPFNIRLNDMRVTEVHHEVNDAGLRITKLTLNKYVLQRMTGEDAVARMLRNLQRGFVTQNAPPVGSAYLAYDGLTFRGETLIQSTGGPVSLTATEEVLIEAGDELTVNADSVAINSDTDVGGRLTARDGLTLLDDDDGEWNFTVIVVRGIPRLVSVERG